MLYITVIIIIYNLLILYIIQSQNNKCNKLIETQTTFFIIQDKKYIITLSYVIILLSIVNYFFGQWIKYLYKLPIVGNLVIFTMYILIGLNIYITFCTIEILNNECKDFNLHIPFYIYIIVYVITISYVIQ